MRQSKLEFIRQQGYQREEPDDVLYAALMLQPRIIGVIVLAGVGIQNAWLFVALAALLGWGAIVPTHNVFNTIYNRTVAYRRGLPPLRDVPAPRRFAMGLAAAFVLVIGAGLMLGTPAIAWIFEGLFVIALIALIFGRRCAGSSLYYRLHRQTPDAQASFLRNVG